MSGFSLGLTGFRAGEDPLTVRSRMSALDAAGFGGGSECLRRDAEQARGVGQVEPGGGAVGSLAEHRDLVMRPECGDALPGPSGAMTGQQTVSI